MKRIIDVNKLYKTYGKYHAVENVSLHINQGEIYGLIGLNGAGKTTLIRLLLGLIKPTYGTAHINGKLVSQKNHHLRNHIGSIVETPHAYPELTVIENLDIQRRLRHIDEPDAVNRVITKLKLTKHKHKKVKHLSLGNKQRLGIARALLHRPTILLLDEPTNGLDPEGIIEIRHLLQELAYEQGVTILISSHLLSELAKTTTTIGIIHEGRLVKQINTEQLQTERLKQLLIDSPKQFLLRKALKNMNVQEREREDGSFTLTDQLAIERPERIAQQLVQLDVPLSKLLVEEENLEQYFLRIIHQGDEQK